MNINETEFWGQLRTLAKLDDSVPVPGETLSRALAIFQPPEKRTMGALNIFSLRPSFTGAVRKAESDEEKLFFELGEEHIVQLEKTRDDTGYHLSGFAHGFDEIPVVLYGHERVYETRIESGSFEFRSLPGGTYTMSFSADGEDYWIRNLEFEDES